MSRRCSSSDFIAPGEMESVFIGERRLFSTFLFSQLPGSPEFRQAREESRYSTSVRRKFHVPSAQKRLDRSPACTRRRDYLLDGTPRSAPLPRNYARSRPSTGRSL